MKEILEFIGQVPHWIKYSQNLEEHLQSLRRKMEYLESVEYDIVTDLANTEQQSGKKRKREVSNWLRRVRNKAVDVRKVEDGLNTVSYLPRFLFHAWLGSCIGKEIEEVNELLQLGLFPMGLLLDAPPDCGEPLVTNELKGEVVGQKLDKIWENLINPSTVRIGVQGPEGIGKSALMTQIFNRLCSFGRVYYVNVPQDSSIYCLQASIAKEIKVELPQPEGSERKRAARICQVLKSNKDFVLILDGLSEAFSLEDVGIPKEGNQGKLIVTSRRLDVCKKMLCQNIVVLESLSREDSYDLFMEKLATNAPLSEEIKNVAVNIIQKCAGIPVKLIDMAVQLRGVTDVNEWKCILSEM